MKGLRLGLSITGGRSPLDPATLFVGSGKGVWFDPSDLSTMWQDSGGTVAAAVDSPVGKINDKSGNGNHWVNTGGTDRPVLRSAGGLYWLEFDGVNDTFVTAPTTWAATSDCFAAIQSTDTQYLVYSDMDNTSAFVGVAQDGNAGAQHLGVGTPTILVDGATAGATRDTLHDAITGATPRVFEADGAAIAFNRLLFGNYVSFEFAGKFYGGIICPANAGERARVRTYLGNKAGITL